MNHTDTMFKQMCDEAADELAKGDKGWKAVDTNTLFLACFGMLYNTLIHNLARPMWFFASTVFIVGMGYLVHLWLG